MFDFPLQPWPNHPFSNGEGGVSSVFYLVALFFLIATQWLVRYQRAPHDPHQKVPWKCD